MVNRNEIIPASEPPVNNYTLWEKIRGTDREDRRLLELTEQVTNKLLTDISEEGRVSLFYTKNNGELITVLCTVYLRSPKIPCLNVTLWNESVSPSQKSINLHREYSGVAQHRKYISAIEARNTPTRRAIAVIQRWDMTDDGYEINYRRDAQEEGSNSPVPRSTSEKIRFLEEILQTTVDKTVTAEPFGRLYVPGDTYGERETKDGRIHHAYWARDLEGKNLRGLLDIG